MIADDVCNIACENNLFGDRYFNTTVQPCLLPVGIEDSQATLTEGIKEDPRLVDIRFLQEPGHRS